MSNKKGQPLEKCPKCGKQGRGKYWRKSHLCEKPNDQSDKR